MTENKVFKTSDIPPPKTIPEGKNAVWNGEIWELVDNPVYGIIKEVENGTKNSTDVSSGS